MKLDVKHMDFDWEDFGRFGTLSGLDQATVLAIMDDYYNTKKKVSEIWAEYGLTGSNRLSREFPLQLLSEKCPYDGHRLVRFMPARNQDPEDYVKKCPKCGHEPYYGDECECAGCRQKRQVQLDDKQKRIREYYLAIRPKRKVKFDQLSPVDQLYLAAMYFLPGNDTGFKVTARGLEFLTPAENWTELIIDDFLRRQIMYVDPTTPARAFKEPPAFGHNPLDVNYLINVKLGKKDTDLFKRTDWAGLKKDKETCCQIWSLLNFFECRTFLSSFLDDAAKDNFEFLMDATTMLKELVADNPLKETKAAILQAGEQTLLKKHQGQKELDDFLEELDNLADGRTLLDPEVIAAVRPKDTVLKMVFEQEVISPKVDADEVVPSTDLIAD